MSDVDDDLGDRVVATEVAGGVIVEELASGDAIVRLDSESDLRARVERQLRPGETVEGVVHEAIQAFARGEGDVERPADETKL